MLTAILAAAASGAAEDAIPVRWREACARVRGNRWLRAALVLAAVAVVVTSGFLPRSFDRSFQARQIALLEWLQEVAGEEHVVLVDPHHPILVPDAAGIHNAWQWSMWIKTGAVKAGLTRVANILLERRPPVVCANPWNPGLNLVTRIGDFELFAEIVDMNGTVVHRWNVDW